MEKKDYEFIFYVTNNVRLIKTSEFQFSCPSGGKNSKDSHF